jgi:hypothetical protein
MIGIVIMALILLGVVQTIQLQRAAVREERLHAEIEASRANAAAASESVRAFLDQVSQETGN